MARTTVAQIETTLNAFMSAQTAHNAQVMALLEDLKPARVTTKSSPAKKATRKAPAKAKPALKGAQTRETLSRKDWNRTVTTLAKTQPKGSGMYALVIAEWALVQDMRNDGATPQDVIAFFKA